MSTHFNSPQSYVLKVQNCMSITTKDDTDAGISIFCGQAPITTFTQLPDSENVRQYLIGSGQRSKKSAVHLAIQETLYNAPQNLPVLSNGITITAEDATFNRLSGQLSLKQPSIINGSQTRGVIKDYLKDLAGTGKSHVPNIKYEVIVSKDRQLMREVSIARNHQIYVKKISMLGAQNLFDDLEISLQTHYSFKHQEIRLRKSETDRGNQFIHTEKLIQLLTALIPDAKAWKQTKRNEYNKVFTYTSQSSCLKLFEYAYKYRHKETKELYMHYIDIAPYAWELYTKLGTCSEFLDWDCGVKINHDRVTAVPDGVLFPIIAAYSNFVVEKYNHFQLIPPTGTDTKKTLITTAHNVFNSIAEKRIEVMGRSRACYVALDAVAQSLHDAVAEELPVVPIMADWTAPTLTEFPLEANEEVE